VTSFGLLGLGGIACFAVGAFLLIDPSEPGYLVDRDFGISWGEVLPVVLVVAALLALVVWKVTEARVRRPITGADGLVGEEGNVSLAVGPGAGKVLVHGELWDARSPQPIAAGARVRVEKVEGLLLTVAPVNGAAGAEVLRPS
jgi:membrane-bound serine protease (ClpP class)